jgi:HK97 family phage major capsid protein
MNDPFDFRPRQGGLDPVTRHTAAMTEALQLREAATRMVRESADMLEESIGREARPRFSITRAINAAISNSRLEAPEREWNERIAESLGAPHTPSKPFIPWSALASRVMIAGTGSQGGYLVADPALQAIDILRPYSTLVRLGAQVFPGMVGDVTMPVVGTGASGAWLAETGTATSGDWTLSQITATPKKISAYVEITQQLLKQSPTVAEPMIRANLLGAVGAAIDQAMLAGTGANTPLGIRYTPGVTLSSGTAFNITAAHGMVADAAASNVIDTNLRFLSTPAARELLALRPVSLGTGTSIDAPVWRDDMLAGKPAFVSANCPSATIFCGDFSQCWLMMWGIGALQLEINPFAHFASGLIGAKVVAHCDVVVARPLAFAVGTAIT